MGGDLCNLSALSEGVSLSKFTIRDRARSDVPTSTRSCMVRIDLDSLLEYPPPRRIELTVSSVPRIFDIY